MNIIRIAEEGLKGKKWTLEEKAKFLYHISCNYFTYDTRYYFANKQEKEELKNRKIDLENVEDNRVVCTSHVKEVCIPLLSIIGIKGEVIDPETHGKAKLKLDQEFYIMDAAGVLDFMRVKLKRNMLGFYPETRRKEYVDQKNPHTKAIDQKIGYIQDDYFSISKENHSNVKENTTSKMYRIQEFLRNHPQIISFNDAMKTISYLEQNWFETFEYEKITEMNLFQDLNGNWDIENVYIIEDAIKPSYFLLKEIENTYTFQEITEEQANFEIKNHKGWNHNSLIR